MAALRERDSSRANKRIHFEDDGSEEEEEEEEEEPEFLSTEVEVSDLPRSLLDRFVLTLVSTTPLGMDLVRRRTWISQQNLMMFCELDGRELALKFDKCVMLFAKEKGVDLIK